MSRYQAALTFLTAALAMPAQAGGARLYETSAADIALASAGYVARAQDSSTVYSNPAGMCLLEPGSDFLLSIQPLFGNVTLSPSGDTTVDGNDGGNALGAFPGGSAFYAGGGERLRWGVGFVGNFGLGLAYEDGWVGRYYVQDTTLLGLTFAPSVAYRLSEKVSIGGSLHAMYGVFDLNVAVNNLLPGVEDGRLGFNDKTWGFGARLGVMIESSERTRFGVIYQSKIDLDFEGRADYEGLGPVMSLVLESADLRDSNLGLSMQVPQALMGSVYHQMGDWSIMGNLGWEDWSEFGKVGVAIVSDDPDSLTLDRSYEDTWHVAVGAQRRLSAWTVSFGTAWDSSVVDDEDRTLDLPLGPALRFGVGGTKRLSGRGPEMTFSYELVWSGDLEVDEFRGPLAGRVAGKYEQAAIHFLGASFRWGKQGAS